VRALRLAWSLVLLLLAMQVFADVEVVSKDLTFSADGAAAPTARIEINSSVAEKNLFFLVRDAQGKLVACLPSGPLPAGRSVVVWDGKDTSGKPAAKGTYHVNLSRGLEWQLDRTFGRDGRIGRFVSEATVADPQKASFPVPGVLIDVCVNGERFYDAAYHKADEAWAAGRNYAFKDGVVTLSPQAGVKAGDTVRTAFYYPVFFENPWDVDVDSQGNLWVVLHWQAPSSPFTWGRLLKLLPAGDKLDTTFGKNGQIPQFSAANHQVIVAEAEKRIYIGGSDIDSYGTGVFALDTGERLLTVGGYFPGTPKTTLGVSGICLGDQNKIYLRPLCSELFAYDRTRATRNADDNGYLYSSMPTGANNAYPALSGVYWGPTLAPATSPATFYMTAWSSQLYKIMDTGAKFTALYHLVLPGDEPLGMSFAPHLNLLFAALRCRRGEVAVLGDTGSSLYEAARLNDPELGGLHTVKWRNGFLYVLEDGATLPEKFVSDYLKDRPDLAPGRNRLSRYTVGFGQETEVCTITRQ
jgi:hypothetical protein